MEKIAISPVGMVKTLRFTWYLHNQTCICLRFLTDLEYIRISQLFHMILCLDLGLEATSTHHRTTEVHVMVFQWSQEEVQAKDHEDLRFAEGSWILWNPMFFHFLKNRGGNPHFWILHCVSSASYVARLLCGHFPHPRNLSKWQTDHAPSMGKKKVLCWCR